MHVPINVKSPNNISEGQMGFNLAFKGLSNNFFSENRAVYEIMSKNMIQPDRPQVTI
jgi:hypothetical protein